MTPCWLCGNPAIGGSVDGPVCYRHSYPEAVVRELREMVTCPVCGKVGQHSIVGPLPNSTAGSDHAFEVSVVSDAWTGERMAPERIESLGRAWADSLDQGGER